MTCIALHNTELTADFVVGFNAAHASIFPDLIHTDPEQPGIWFLNADPALSAQHPAYALYQSGMLLLNVIQLPPYPFKVVESLQPDVLLVVEDMAIANAESIYATVHSFRDVHIDALAVEGCIHRVQVSAGAGLVRALQAFLCLTMAEHCATLENAEKRLMGLALFDRHAHLLNQANAPYLLRYMFARDILSTWRDERRLQLEMPGMSLTGTNSQEARFEAISQFLHDGYHLIDIGCGKAFQLTRLAANYRRVVGYEANPETLEIARAHIQKLNLGKIQLKDAFKEYSAREIPAGAHVLMTEVLEHMPLEHAQKILQALSTCVAEKMVFTLPNRLFNKHYGLPDGAFRHWDHHWEPDANEFHRLFDNTFGERWLIKFSKVGDVVNGQPSTFMAVVSQRHRSSAFFWDVEVDQFQPPPAPAPAHVVSKPPRPEPTAEEKAEAKKKAEARKIRKLQEKAAADREAAEALQKAAQKAEARAAALSLKAAKASQQESAPADLTEPLPKSKRVRKSPSKPVAPKAEPSQG